MSLPELIYTQAALNILIGVLTILIAALQIPLFRATRWPLTALLGGAVAFGLQRFDLAWFLVTTDYAGFQSTVHAFGFNVMIAACLFAYTLHLLSQHHKSMTRRGEET